MVSAIPGILATLPPNSDEQVVYEDDGVTPVLKDGEPLKISSAQFLLNLLAKMRNHQVAVAPDGTTFTLLEANTEGQAFTSALDHFSKEITLAILLQQLATKDSQHQTKSSTGSQFRIVDLLVFWVRDITAEMVKYDILKPLVRYNFGDDVANELLPQVSYGDTEARDWATDAAAIASMADKVTESQWDHLTSQLGIPLPTNAERSFRAMAKVLGQQQQQTMIDSAGQEKDAQGNPKPAADTGKPAPGKDNAK
jgi:phage gp29-like protein